MIDLRGSLQTIDLLPLVRLLSKPHQTGTLVLAGNGWSARVGLQNGRVVAASVGTEKGLRALMALNLVMGEAEFVYLDGLQPGEHEFDLTPEGLSAHLARQEGTALDLDAVPRLVSRQVDEADEMIILKRSTVQRLMAIDGRRTIGEIVGDEPTLASLLALAQLLELGLIRLEPRVWEGIRVGLSKVPGERINGSTAERGVHGAFAAATPGADRGQSGRSQVLVCPKLGLADDTGSYFPRPTPLHRCYATGSGQRLTSSEQREVCMTDQYTTCPRLDVGQGGLSPVSEPRVLPSDVFDRPRLASANARSHGGVDGTSLGRSSIQHGRLGPSVTSPEWATEPTEIDIPALTNGHYPAVAPDGTTSSADQNRGSATPRGRLDRLMPAVAIVLAAAAVIATVLVFLRPMAAAPRAASAPAPTVLATQPTTQSAPATSVSMEATPATTRAAAAPTTPPLPSPTVSTGRPGERSAPSAPLVLAADFSTRQPNWAENPPYATWSGGSYRVSASADRFVAVAAPLPLPVGDVTVSGSFRKTGGPPGGGYGLILRDQEANQRDGATQTGHYYVLEVGDKGDFGIWRRDSDHWIDLVSWTASKAVHIGTATNELEARAVGTQLTLSVNGVEVSTVTDSALSSGGAGIFVGGDSNDVAVDRFSVHVPSQVSPR